MCSLLILYVTAGVLLMILSLPLIYRKVKPNPYYGFRIGRTMESTNIWYAANRYSGKRLLAAGAGIVFTAIPLYFVPGISVDSYALACLAVFTIILAVGFVQSYRYMKTL